MSYPEEIIQRQESEQWLHLGSLRCMGKSESYCLMGKDFPDCDDGVVSEMSSGDGCLM